jgi:glycosyltransferase involved in cell wall biosynthesis
MVIVLGEWLKRRGHNVLTVCPPGSWLTDRLRTLDRPVVEMSMHGMNAPSAVFKLRNLACETPADIIHTHLTRAAYIGHLAGRMAHIPVISTVHVIQRNPAYRYLPNRDRSVVAVSDFLRQNLIATGVPEGRIQTVYNGTDFAFEGQSLPAADNGVRIELGLPPASTLIGMFGQINAFKGSTLLVEAAHAIMKRFPEAYFVFVGSAKPAFQQELIELARANGVLDHLRFTGVRSDVQRIMAAMDVITLPSCYEACSMAIIEAMAVGKPVVATRAGGNPELVQDGETGLLIERTREALADALISILEDTHACKRMGEAAHQVAKTRFSASVMVAQIEALYNDLVGANTLVSSSVPSCE